MGDLNKAWQWAVNTCNATNVGYSQKYRNAQTVNGITYYDCSSFVWYALKAGGFENIGNSPFTTRSMGAILEEAGFTKKDSVSSGWLAGDIMWKNGHTEMCYKPLDTGIGGVCMGAHSATGSLANQVSIGDVNGNASYVSTSSRFPVLYRYGDSGATGYGFSIYVIAALAANAWQESTINSGLSQKGGTAFGIFQWDGSRRDKLITWLSENGYEKDSTVGQLEYLIIEADWKQNVGVYTTLDEFLHSDSTDLEALTSAFCYNWERPGKPEIEKRYDYANRAYQYIQQHANDTSITDFIVSSDYLTVTQTLNNAVMLYRYFSAGQGGGGGKGHRRYKSKGLFRPPIFLLDRR